MEKSLVVQFAGLYAVELREAIDAPNSPYKWPDTSDERVGLVAAQMVTSLARGTVHSEASNPALKSARVRGGFKSQKELRDCLKLDAKAFNIDLGYTR